MNRNDSAVVVSNAPVEAPRHRAFEPHVLRRFGAASMLALSLAACAGASAQAVAERDGLLTHANGMTLYTFDQDDGGRSACSGGCAPAWPPFNAADGAKASGRYTLASRDDGARQWAIDGKPLYFFAGDRKAGDANGDGQGGVWHVVRMKRASARAGFDYGATYGYPASPASGYGY